MSAPTADQVTVRRHPGPARGGEAIIAEIVLDRPAAMNALSTGMAAQLTLACAGLAADPQVRAVVLSASGDRAFCVGADLKERAAMSDSDFMAQRPVFRAAFGGVLSLPQPVVAGARNRQPGAVGQELQDVAIPRPSALRWRGDERRHRLSGDEHHGGLPLLGPVAPGGERQLLRGRPARVDIRGMRHPAVRRPVLLAPERWGDRQPRQRTVDTAVGDARRLRPGMVAVNVIPLHAL